MEISALTRKNNNRCSAPFFGFISAARTRERVFYLFQRCKLFLCCTFNVYVSMQFTRQWQRVKKYMQFQVKNAEYPGIQ